MKYIIFDLDGTLLDSMGIWENMDLELLARFDIIPEKAMRERIRTLSVRESCELFITTYDLKVDTEFLINELAAIGEAKYISEVKLKPFVKDTLDRLKGKGVQMCIATAAAKKNVMPVLKRHHLTDYFCFVVASDDVPSGKNEPEMYWLCAEKMGAKPSEILVVEDTLHAVKTAKKAGFKVAGLYDAYSAEDEQSIREIADLYLMHLGELEGLM